MPRLTPLTIVLGLAALVGACGGGGNKGGPSGSGGMQGGAGGLGAGGADTAGGIGSGGSIPDGAITGDGGRTGDAASDAPPVPRVLSATLDGQAEAFMEDTVTAAVSQTTVMMNATRNGGVESILISIYASAPITGPGGTYACATGAATIQYQKSTTTDTYYLANMTLGSCQITLTDFTDVSIAGTFTAKLVTGGAEPGIVVTSGAFSAPH